MKSILFIVLLVVSLVILFSEESGAIPAFARKYSLSCQTCHSPTPRLKDFGDEFAGNGFKLSDTPSPRNFVETGDSKLSLLRDLPLAVRFDAFATYNVAAKEKGDFGVPYTLKVMSGGEIADDISYYFYFYMSERGELVGVEDCYIMFNNLFGADLDLYFGQFQISDPLFKRELRLTLEDYQIYKVKPGLSRLNYAYDRGIMLTYGFDWGTDIIFEVVNGCGIGEADDDKLFDNDRNKILIGRVSQDVADFLRIGGIIMSGNEDMGQLSSVTNKILSFGGDMTLNLSDIIELNMQYIHRKDDNVVFDAMDISGNEIKTQGAMAELIFTPKKDDSDWYGAALFNFVESDFDALDYKTTSLHIGYLLKRNLRLVLEGTYNFSDDEHKFAQFSLGLVTAF
jgi:hypothetical protein